MSLSRPHLNRNLAACLRLAVAGILAGIAVLLAGCRAYADGGHIAAQQVIGAYSLTLFTAPEPLVSGPVDLSLLVEDSATGEVLDQATATGTLARQGSSPLSLTLIHAAASNKLLLAATAAVPVAGSYQLTITVARPGASPVTLTTLLPVAQDHRRRTTLLFALLLPLTAILLFLANQQAKQKLRRHRPALH